MLASIISSKRRWSEMLAFSNDYYGFIFRVTQSVELFCTYDVIPDKLYQAMISWEFDEYVAWIINAYFTNIVHDAFLLDSGIWLCYTVTGWCYMYFYSDAIHVKNKYFII